MGPQYFGKISRLYQRQFLIFMSFATLVGVVDLSWSVEAVLLGYPRHAHLLYDDLVVSGTVQAVKTELMPARVFRPTLGPNYDGSFAQVYRVTVRIDEVMRGTCDEPTLDIIAEEGRVIENLFATGQQVIAATVYRPWMMGGSHELISDAGYYVKSNSKWISRGVAYEFNEVRGAINSVSVESLASTADAVVTGVVETVRQYDWRSEKNELAVIQVIELRVLETKRGANVPDVVTIETIIKGSYWPEWRGIMPKEIKGGDNLYLFLEKHDETYRVVGGANGCLKVTAQGIIYNDTVLIRQSERELDLRVRNAERRKE